MAVMTTGDFGKALWPGLNEIFGGEYEQYENGAEWKRIFSISPSEKNFEEDLAIATLGLAKVKAETSPTEYDTMQQAYVTRYQNLTYTLGYMMSLELMEDNLYASLSQQLTKALAYSYNQTLEIVAALVLERGHDPFYPGGDGQPLFSDSHPIVGGTFSNKPQVPVDLNEKSLEQAVIDIGGFVDFRGKIMKILPDKVIVPRELEFDLVRILKNAKNRPDTADRDINALYVTNSFPGGLLVEHFLEDPDQWIIQTKVPNGFKCFQRKAPEFLNDNDYDTDNLKFKVRGRTSFKWSDPRCAYGSEGH